MVSDGQDAKKKKGAPTMALTDSFVEVDFKRAQPSDEANAVAFLGGNSFTEDKTVRTITQECTLSPEWNERLCLPEYAHHTVSLAVYDEDTTGMDELIGYVDIPTPPNKRAEDVVQEGGVMHKEVPPQVHEYPLVISEMANEKQKEGEKLRTGKLFVGLQWRWMPLAKI
jgi:hypothetical protein